MAYFLEPNGFNETLAMPLDFSEIFNIFRIRVLCSFLTNQETFFKKNFVISKQMDVT